MTDTRTLKSEAAKWNSVIINFMMCAVIFPKCLVNKFNSNFTGQVIYRTDMLDVADGKKITDIELMKNDKKC